MREGRFFTVDVAADGEGLVSHAGAALLAETADRVGLTRELSRALGGVRERITRHDPGRVIRDLAVMLADGGDCLSDLRAVREQEPLFGSVASDSTAFRLLDRIAGDPGLLDAMRARARAGERAWGLGMRPQRIMIDIDATLIGAHSEKGGTAVNFKGPLGFIRCLRIWIRAARRWRGCCAQATPLLTARRRRSRSLSRRWSSSPTRSCPI